MFGHLLPRETIFFDLFEKHAKITLQAAQALLSFMEADPAALGHRGNPIKQMELEADEIAFQCIETLHKSFITPLQPDDIMHLITRMDDVIDCINKIFEDCMIYKITHFTAAAKEMGGLIVLAVEKLELLIKGLRRRKDEHISMRQTSFEIHQIENQGDELLRNALGKLFDEESDLRLLIKWKDIYELMEEAIDYSEDVSNIVEGFLMEYD